ncbi:miz zinc finger domain containing protein [Grosmannia clavigera kw1407]|uniref:Miz zinc finger domain containing protein n=1 Tax=Grosmannia clavigera (strain kw1407 / UAMH 11150) TaxID=655863 RepID=F0XHB9_GROCL|nr:miz zinc finger domain containing protein [Grosmannia clavigera kw1407]EFX03094.1 miz zinc finger domain containing protein [Grosmannia clavigera kw1407]
MGPASLRAVCFLICRPLFLIRLFVVAAGAAIANATAPSKPVGVPLHMTEPALSLASQAASLRVLPSPSPSDEPSPATVALNSPLQYASVPPSASASGLDNALVAAMAAAITSATATASGSTVAHPGSGSLWTAASRPTISQPTAQQPTRPPPSAPSSPAQYMARQDQWLSSQQQASRLTDRNTEEVSGLAAMATAPAMPAATAGFSNSPRTPSFAASPITPIIPILPSNGVPYKRNYSGQIVTPTAIHYNSCIGSIDSTINSAGGPARLSQDCEFPRFILLRKACRSNDGFYLALHQLFNIWSLRHEDVYGIFRDLSPQQVDTSFTKLEDILRKNDIIRLSLRQYFTVFPCDIKAMMSGPFYAKVFPQIVCFLNCLRQRWDDLLLELSRRAYPVLMDETVGILGCISPTLQECIFTCTRSRLGAPNASLSNEYLVLFHDDQMRHYVAPGKFVSRMFNGLSELEQINADLIKAYLGLMQTARAQAKELEVTQSPGMHNSAAMQLVSVSMPESYVAQVPQLQMPQVRPDLASEQASKLQGNPPFQRLSHHAEAAAVQPQTQEVMPTSADVFILPSPSASASSISVQSPAVSVQPQVLSASANVQQPAATRKQMCSPATSSAIDMYSGLEKRLIPKTRRIPRSEYPHSPTDSQSLQGGLHEAPIRSPVRVLFDLNTGESLADRPGQERFYQSVHHMAIGPVSTPARSHLYRFEFQVTQDEYDHLASREVPPGELLPVVKQSSGSLRYRIRCCKAPSTGKVMTEAEWLILDTTWPMNIFINLNGSVVSVRRKAHSGKDLAAEMTSMINVGTNKLQVAIPETGVPADALLHVLGVEVVKTEKHSDVVGRILSQGFRQPSKTVEEIRRRLATAPGGRGDDDNDDDDDDDDGFAVVQADLSVDLADPFTAKVFETPVRGVNCLHMECFDLSIWLTTRPLYSITPCQHQAPCRCCKVVQLSQPDKWRCPICSQDARPKSLRVDGFLLDVRNQLEKNGTLSRARSSWVAPDGTWRPILGDEGDEDDETGDETGEPARKIARIGSASRLSTSRRASQAIGVIELD